MGKEYVVVGSSWWVLGVKLLDVSRERRDLGSLWVWYVCKVRQVVSGQVHVVLKVVFSGNNGTL